MRLRTSGISVFGHIFSSPLPSRSYHLRSFLFCFLFIHSCTFTSAPKCLHTIFVIWPLDGLWIWRVGSTGHSRPGSTHNRKLIVMINISTDISKLQWNSINRLRLFSVYKWHESISREGNRGRNQHAIYSCQHVEFGFDVFFSSPITEKSHCIINHSAVQRVYRIVASVFPIRMIQCTRNKL